MASVWRTLDADGLIVVVLGASSAALEAFRDAPSSAARDVDRDVALECAM